MFLNGSTICLVHSYGLPVISLFPGKIKRSISKASSRNQCDHSLIVIRLYADAFPDLRERVDVSMTTTHPETPSFRCLDTPSVFRTMGLQRLSWFPPACRTDPRNS